MVGATLALTAQLAAPRSASAQPFEERLTLRLEGGIGAMLSPYQRNTDPSEYGGSTPGYRFGTQGSARLALTLDDPIAVQVSISNWFFLSDTRDTAWVIAPMVGLHFEPTVGTAGRFFADANVGYAMTGAERRFTFDVALGFEGAISRAVGIGPVLRYGQVFQPDSTNGVFEPFPQDARYLTLGMSLALRIPHPLPLPPPPAPRRPGDFDRDGVDDPADVCALVAQGEHPDTRRPGCPAPDSDGDGFFDDRDQCINVAAGAHPDPTRDGCPDTDADNDGVFNRDDQCPSTPQGRAPDPARAGCPEGDRDRDGYVDHLDHCPELPEDFDGVEDDDGCPDTDASSVHVLIEIGESHVINISHPINFVTASDRIVGMVSFRVLAGVRSILGAHPEISHVEIQGHTDNRGSPSTNLALSTRRANAVRLWLIQHGLEASRVTSRGFGQTVPLRPNTTAENRSINRRVEFHILGLEAR